MHMKTIINTPHAPTAIGTYSQAVRVDNTVYISGQIPLDPKTMQMVNGNFSKHVAQVFENLKAVAIAAHSDLSHIVKLTVYVRDLEQFGVINEIMATYFQAPYPARAVVEVSRLPKDAVIEMDAVLIV